MKNNFYMVTRELRNYGTKEQAAVRLVDHLISQIDNYSIHINVILIYPKRLTL